MERLRRWVLLGGFALRVLVVLYVLLPPLVIVTLADSAAEQKNDGRSIFLNSHGVAPYPPTLSGNGPISSLKRAPHNP